MHPKCNICKFFQKHKECELFFQPYNCNDETLKLQSNLDKQIKEDVRTLQSLQKDYPHTAKILGRVISDQIAFLRELRNER